VSIAHRTQLRTLTNLAIRDLSLLWARLDKSDAEATRDALTTILPQLVTMYGAAAATLAADWFDEQREEAGVRGRFRAIPAELPDIGRTDSLAGWAVGPLFGADPNPLAALAKVSGGLQRIIANADRETITRSSIADPQAVGWKRVGDGATCEWCRGLISRGAVYSEATASFDAHDGDGCIAAPVFK